MVLASYLLIILPATVIIIIIMFERQINTNSEKLQYIAKLLKPAVIAIVMNNWSIGIYSILMLSIVELLYNWLQME